MLKIILLGLISISLVACHGPGGHGGYGGHGGHGGFHGGGGGHGGFHGGHGGRRPWGHGNWHGSNRWEHGGRPGHHEHREPDDPRPDHKNPSPSGSPQVNFIVHEPQGIEVWIVKQPEITSFGIELYVNRDSRETKPHCDLCANTTEVTYGKFFIENADVLVKKGDTLSYYFWVGRGSQFTRSGLQTLVVGESIITQCDCGTSNIEDIDIRINDPDKRTARQAIFVRKSGHPTTEATDPETIRKEYGEDMINECEIDPEQCKASKEEIKGDRVIKDPHQEIDMLEDIVEHMKDGSCLPKITNQLVLLRQAPFAANGDGDLMNFVRSYVGISAELQSLGEGIASVIPANPGVGQGVIFEMNSYVDKQRILYHVRVNELKHIVDYDLTENSY